MLDYDIFTFFNMIIHYLFFVNQFPDIEKTNNIEVQKMKKYLKSSCKEKPIVL